MGGERAGRAVTAAQRIAHLEQVVRNKDERLDALNAEVKALRMEAHAARNECRAACLHVLPEAIDLPGFVRAALAEVKAHRPGPIFTAGRGS